LAGKGGTVKKIIRMALAIIALSCGAAPGKDKDGNFVVVGMATCGKWHEASRGRDVQSRVDRNWYVGWLEGYISGVNSQSAQDARVDAPGIKAYVDLYCTNNPLHRLAQAADALIEETGGPKAVHTWKK
jgi:hypothetical protein